MIFALFRTFDRLGQTLLSLKIPSQNHTWIFISNPFQKASLTRFPYFHILLTCSIYSKKLYTSHSSIKLYNLFIKITYTYILL